MDAERKRDVRAIPLLRGSAVVRPCEGLKAILHVAVAARIEERLPGDAAGAPVLADAVGRRHAELVIELLVGERAQHVLVEDRDLAPLLRILEPLEIDALELRAPESRAPRLLHRKTLALGLDAPDLGARLRKLERHAATGGRSRRCRRRRSQKR